MREGLWRLLRDEMIGIGRGFCVKLSACVDVWEWSWISLGKVCVGTLVLQKGIGGNRGGVLG